MANLVKLTTFSFIFLFCNSVLFGQDEPIYLSNSSFEQAPYAGGNDNAFGPKGWYNCGKAGETPPDIQPNLDPFEKPFFEVTTKAQHGMTYLGLVIRDNDTWEAIGQRLKTPLEAGKCYEFSLHLARSDRYVSARDGKSGEINHNTPSTIRIYGGNGYCQKRQLLDETGPIAHTKWKKYNFRFEPNNRMNFILIEAFYKTPTPIPYNGNVLIDNLSNIIPVPCSNEVLPDEEPAEENLLASKTELVPDKKVNKKPSRPKPTPPVEKIPDTYDKPNQDRIAATPAKPKPKKPRKLRRGETIKIDQLYFEINDSLINKESYAALDDLYLTLSQYKNVVIEIQGHTNGNCDEIFCNRLSTARAKAVAEYFHGKGIGMDRLKYKGYGKRKPLASNKYAAGRKKNQRVVIKILSLDG